jgi:hypothetical protein
VVKGKFGRRDLILLFEEYLARLIKPGADYNMFQILNFNIKLFKGRNIYSQIFPDHVH